MARHDFESQRLAVKAWNDSHPDVTIKMDEVVGDTWDYYRIKMMQELAAGNPPDTVFTDVWYFRIYAIDNVFMNLEPLIDKDGQFKKSDLWDVCVTNCSSPDIHGQMYCLPYDYGTHALAFNKKIFDEEKIPYLDKTKEYSWENDILPLALELTRDLNGKKATESGFDPLRIDRYGVNPYTYLYWWYITQAGGQCFDESFTKSTMNSPEALDGIQFLYDLQNKYYVSPSPAYQEPAHWFPDRQDRYEYGGHLGHPRLDADHRFRLGHRAAAEAQGQDWRRPCLRNGHPLGDQARRGCLAVDQVSFHWFGSGVQADHGRGDPPDQIQGSQRYFHEADPASL